MLIEIIKTLSTFLCSFSPHIGQIPEKKKKLTKIEQNDSIIETSVSLVIKT